MTVSSFMAAQDTSHFLLVPAPGWGHVRPICHLALRLVDCDHKIVVTIFTAPYTFTKAQAEIADHIQGSDKPNSRIRVLTISEAVVRDPKIVLGSFFKAYPAAYKVLNDGHRITCMATGATYNSVQAPIAILIDSFLAPLLHATRAVTGMSVPVIAVATGCTLHLMRGWGPERLGGKGNFVSHAEAEALRTGEESNVVGVKMLQDTDGTIVNLPGLPPMYDYEFFPQDLPLMPVIFMIMKSGHDIYKNCDGVLLFSSYAVEKRGIDGIKAWFSEAQKDVHNIGPLLPCTYWDSTQSDQGATGVRTFLDAMHRKFGEKSVILISFGSFFWPPVQEYLEELIISLIEKEFPFILSHPSPSAKVPPEIIERIKSSGIGISSTWVPQQFVLTHPATGWFLTHAGQGGVTEALARGIPLICWPLEGDQSVAAVDLSYNLRVAFELVEVRTGQGLKPIHRLGGRSPEGTRTAVGREIRDVIDQVRGKAGKEMRQNAVSIGKELRESWAEDGDAARDLRAFVKKMTC